MADLPVRFTIDISTAAIVKVIVAILVLFFLSLISNVILLVFIAFVLSAAIDPFIDAFQRRGIHRGVGVAVIYLVALSVVSMGIAFLIPPIVTEVQALIKDLPERYASVSAFLDNIRAFSQERGYTQNLDQFLQSIGQQAGKIGGNLFAVIGGVAGGFFSAFLILVLTFYLSISEGAMRHLIRLLTPRRHEERAIRVLDLIQTKMGLWLRGQLILSFIIFLFTLVGLLILGVKYAWALAFLAGIMELIPFFGPTLAAIPAVFVGFTQSPLTGVLVLAMYILVQQIENHLLVPNIMKRTVGLHPLVVVIAVLIGVKLVGVVGALLAVPVATTVILIAKELSGEKDEKWGFLHFGTSKQGTPS